MASFFHLLVNASLLLLFSATMTTGQPPPSSSDPFFLGPQKQTHLHFFLHNIVTGPNPTAVLVASVSTTNSTSTGFGAITTVDNPLTEGADVNSKLIGRAQGIYAAASMEDASQLLTMNFAFVDGEFKGSSLAILGRNAVSSGESELPVVGGSGQFRWSKGYALANTRVYNSGTGDATVEYDVHVTGNCDSSTACDSSSGGPAGGGPGGATTTDSSKSPSSIVVHVNVAVTLMIMITMITFHCS